ncbi:protein translocase subunit SecD [Litorivicinus lipolyticus]|uniref:Protein translocase subunit SecD n=1 Tax=Litorivicinus lipolyticus TaxID=418701 RepID=A0A5Q2QCG5_9GAMM|nr:protein translocase subunit SecD [Litorivicinus lipolyticus]QGG79706.1 protein translocase subunit SecD [Litorivicinus lipolyticus]
MNRFPLWKNTLIAALLAIGFLYAAPNLFPDDAAIQLAGSRGSVVVDQVILDRADRALADAGITPKSSAFEGSLPIIRLNDAEAQLQAKAVVQQALGDDYLVALNLAETTPDWLAGLGAGPMKLGLDLRGGVHFLMEVDLETAIAQRLDVYSGEIKRILREDRIRYRAIDVDKDGTLSVRFRDADVRDAGETRLRTQYAGEFTYRSDDDGDDFFVRLNLAEARVSELEANAVEQNLTTLRNRVNELGVSEPLVQRQGKGRILIQLPGVQDTAAAKRILGATANLDFRLEAQADARSSETETFKFRSEPRSAIIERDVIVTGSQVAGASASFDENGRPQVNIDLDGPGGRAMNRVTRDSVGRRMAVLFIEYRVANRYVDKPDGTVETIRERKVEKSIISLATIQSALGNSFRITGLDSPQEASELALLLRAGALAAPIYFVEERTVGPSLGAANIAAGTLSVMAGLALVVLFMLVYYKMFGLIANVALGLNLVMLVSIMSMLSATLTLPGIAGIVLTVGMAVDANVLIFSRIKEERARGMNPQQAIKGGFDRAFVTILDANLTTLIVAVILFAVGTGPVQGFAVTLSVGIITSMFTAIWVTRALVNLVYGNRAGLQRLSI